MCLLTIRYHRQCRGSSRASCRVFVAHLGSCAFAYRMRVLLISICSLACALEPLAPFASQTAWQAGEPINVNVDYDVPAFSLDDASQRLQEQSAEHGERELSDAGAGTQGLDTAPSPLRALGVTREADPATSFLATKVLPIVADKIKNSLYVTQSMRSPPQASVNVIMHENIEEAERRAKYQGMKTQAAKLKEYVRRRLAGEAHA